MLRATRFTDPTAVDAWDNWFRWRDAGCLHDRTIDATWWRVASAIASSGNADGRRWAERYVEAFSRWQLLPDEWLLRVGGTGAGLPCRESACATLNAAAFVIAPHSRQARFDDERFVDIAALAVRMLDDATLVAHRVVPGAVALRIGLLGFGDALHLLGIAYVDPQAVELATLIGTLMASGTLHGTLELTEERGTLGPATSKLLSIWRDRRVPDRLIQAAEQNGVRHSGLTAIESQERLALLANNASDALDPRSMSTPDEKSCTSMNAHSCTGMLRESTTAAQLGIRVAIQPWIDAPIDYPMAQVG